MMQSGIRAHPFRQSGQGDARSATPQEPENEMRPAEEIPHAVIPPHDNTEAVQELLRLLDVDHFRDRADGNDRRVPAYQPRQSVGSTHRQVATNAPIEMAPQMDANPGDPQGLPVDLSVPDPYTIVIPFFPEPAPPRTTSLTNIKCLLCAREFEFFFVPHNHVDMYELAERNHVTRQRPRLLEDVLTRIYEHALRRVQMPPGHEARAPPITFQYLRRCLQMEMRRELTQLQVVLNTANSFYYTPAIAHEFWNMHCKIVVEECDRMLDVLYQRGTSNNPFFGIYVNRPVAAMSPTSFRFGQPSLASFTTTTTRESQNAAPMESANTGIDYDNDEIWELNGSNRNDIAMPAGVFNVSPVARADTINAQIKRFRKESTVESFKAPRTRSANKIMLDLHLVGTSTPQFISTLICMQLFILHMAEYYLVGSVDDSLPKPYQQEDNVSARSGGMANTGQSDAAGAADAPVTIALQSVPPRIASFKRALDTLFENMHRFLFTSHDPVLVNRDTDASPVRSILHAFIYERILSRAGSIHRERSVNTARRIIRSIFSEMRLAILSGAHSSDASHVQGDPLEATDQNRGQIGGSDNNNNNNKLPNLSRSHRKAEAVVYNGKDEAI